MYKISSIFTEAFKNKILKKIELGLQNIKLWFDDNSILNLQFKANENIDIYDRLYEMIGRRFLTLSIDQNKNIILQFDNNNLNYVSLYFPSCGITGYKSEE